MRGHSGRPVTQKSPNDESRNGVLFALGAFIIWGLIPLYFKKLEYISTGEIVAFRVVFAVILLLVILTAIQRQSPWRLLREHKKVIPYLMISAALLGVNWLTFIWSFAQERVLETSLGYFINPLFNVLLGMLFLGERLRPAALVAVAIATVGVLYRVTAFGEVPWVALTLAITFGFYGLLRKKIRIDSLSGLFIEMLVLLPLAFGYATYLSLTGESHFSAGGWGVRAWLLLLGPLTVAPLSLFAAGASRINLSTLGFIQYLAPSLTFLIAVFIFREPFDVMELVTFACIWLSLVIYSVDALRANRVSLSTEEAQ